MKSALVGFMGAGKSTAARSLGAAAADVDELIEARSGRTVQEIFAQDGEAAFRELEEQAALELLADSAIHTVALGGGALASARVRDALTKVRVIWLDVEVDLAWQRIGGGKASGRPLARDPQAFERLHAERRPVYEALADVIVPASRAARLNEILETLDGLDAKEARVLWATTGSGDYPVYIGRGLVSERQFWPAKIAGRRVVISDYNAGRHYGGRAVQDARPRGDRLDRDGSSRRDAHRSGGGGWGWRGWRPCRFLCSHLPAWYALRAGADNARSAG
jgi:shikimate kinase/3-dehydroquinate synthase